MSSRNISSSYDRRVSRAKSFFNQEFINCLLQAHGADKMIDAILGDGAVIVQFSRKTENGFIKAFPDRQYHHVLFEAKLTDYLYDKGLPVPQLFHSPCGDAVVSVSWESMKIPSIALKQLSGSPINQMNEHNSRLLAAILANFHLSTALYQPKEKSAYADFFIPKAVQTWKTKLKPNDLCYSLVESWLDLWEETKNYFSFSNPFIIHGDLHAGNILVNDKEIGIIDLSDARIGFPEEDLGKLLHLHGKLLGLNFYEFSKENFLLEYARLAKRLANFHKQLCLTLLFAAYYALKHAVVPPAFLRKNICQNIFLARNYLDLLLNELYN